MAKNLELVVYNNFGAFGAVYYNFGAEGAFFAPKALFFSQFWRLSALLKAPKKRRRRC